MLHGGVLQRPNTAPEGPTDTGGAKNAAGSGAAAVMALSCPPSTGQTQQQQHPSSRQPPQQPQRPSTGRSTCSGSSNLTAQGIELARLQARTAWDVSPLQRGEPQSTAGTHKLPPRIFIPRPTASAAPYPPIYSPGPGAYSPTVFRRGDHSSLGGQSFGGGSPPRAWAFGSANQRPRHVCLHFRDDSPGPVYLPSKDRLSTSPCPVNHKFDHNLTGGRYSLTAGQPGNAPMFNPGPGTYEPATTAAGDSLSPGRSGAMPAYSFSHTRKLLIPAIDGAALPVLSKEHVREYYGTLSPGPAHYSPETSPTRMAAPAYSIKGRRACWFDPLELSPGPIYKPNELDRRGGHSLGDAPYATIGKGPKVSCL
ncbi:hypothetical protein Vretifemale_3543 [Volvox reticuliferus]|nr:hypothetical protein Vretifemale_3543 [Volvox reticuliferus]